MKTILLATVILTMWFDVNAQTTPTNACTIVPKATALNPLPTTAGQPATREIFLMKDNEVKAVKGGLPFAMPADRWLANGTVITPGGTVLTNSGKRVYLQNGESIDGNGVITTNRCHAFEGIEIYGQGTCMVE